MQDLLVWLNDVDGVIAASKPVGGLPETASEQLERFMVSNLMHFLCACREASFLLLLFVLKGQLDVEILIFLLVRKAGSVVSFPFILFYRRNRCGYATVYVVASPGYLILFVLGPITSDLFPNCSFGSLFTLCFQITHIRTKIPFVHKTLFLH